ncbi:VOC family protein [Cupriavidus sp. 2TAF22]|uniref:VOC family protein n=1 Tax=unclassified Cupriavidus TaxID=2640874 RepID=UPI003F91E196
MNEESMTVGIDHIGLSVPDLARTRDFFIQCLGWKQVGEKPDYPAAFVSDGKVLVTLWQVADVASFTGFDRKTNVGLHHLALRVATEEKFNEVFERVSKWPGVVVEFSPEQLGAGPKRHTMLCEPGGIRIEFDFDPRVAAG